MNVEVDQDKYGDVHGVTVTLSRRNLLTLLAKLDGHPPDSACTIVRAQNPEHLEREPKLTVTAEPDDVHYGERPYPPGQMVPSTEAVVRGVDPLTALGYRAVHSDNGATHYVKVEDA